MHRCVTSLSFVKRAINAVNQSIKIGYLRRNFACPPLQGSRELKVTVRLRRGHNERRSTKEAIHPKSEFLNRYSLKLKYLRNLLRQRCNQSEEEEQQFGLVQTLQHNVKVYDHCRR